MGVNYLDLVTQAGSTKDGSYAQLNGADRAQISAGIAKSLERKDAKPTLASYNVELKRDGIAAQISALGPETRAKLHYLTNREELTGGDMYGDIKHDLQQYSANGKLDSKKIDDAFKAGTQADKDSEAESLTKSRGDQTAFAAEAAIQAHWTHGAAKKAPSGRGPGE